LDQAAESVEELLRAAEVGGTIQLRIDKGRLNAEVHDRVSPIVNPSPDPGGRVQTPSRPWLQMRAVSLAGSRRWKALESLTAGSSSPEPPGQLIATDMGAIRSQSVGWVCFVVCPVLEMQA
jgi:hypothetical protein